MEGSKFVIIAAIAANLLIACAKFVAAFFTRSSAMLTEGIHSLVDTGDGGLLLLGARLGAKPPDRAHPFGHGREVYFWSFVVAIMIFAVGGGISIYEGILRIIRPNPLAHPGWNFAVLGVSFVFEGSSFVIALRHFVQKKRSSDTLLRAMQRSKNPADFMVVLEDSAALLGILVAAGGVALEMWTGNPVYDGAASVVIGSILAVVATLLAVETKGLLVGEGLAPEYADAIRAIVEADPAVERAGDPLSSYLGPETIVMNLEIRFRRDLQTSGIEQAIDRIQKSIQEKHPHVKRIFIAAEAFEDE